MNRHTFYSLLAASFHLLFIPKSFGEGVMKESFSIKGDDKGGPFISSKQLSKPIKLIVGAAAHNAKPGGFVPGQIQCLGEGTKTLVAKYVPIWMYAHEFDIVLECTFVQ